jgi:hypothetical protein
MIEPLSGSKNTPSGMLGLHGKIFPLPYAKSLLLPGTEPPVWYAESYVEENRSTSCY